MDSEVLCVRMDKEIKDKLRKLAEKEHRSLTNLLECLILKRYEEWQDLAKKKD